MVLGAQSRTRLARLHSDFAMNTHFHKNRRHVPRIELMDVWYITSHLALVHVEDITAVQQLSYKLFLFDGFGGVCQLTGSNPSGDSRGKY